MSDYPFLSDPGLVPNSTPTDQQVNFRDATNVTAKPEAAPKSANDVAFQASRASILSDMMSVEAVNVQTLPVVASGDMSAGGFESHVDRTPKVKGL